MTHYFWRRAPFALALLAASSAAHAQHEHKEIIEEVVIHAHPLSGEGLAQSVQVLEGEALARQVAASLGDTVATQPGVHSSSFGPAVGRPVIRGVGGPRVRVMEDRIDTMDASVSSGDHATSVEPFIADRVEILKGSSTLLYGSGAIGGVVDVHTGRIPHAVPETVTGRALVRSQSNGQGETLAGRADGGAGNFAWHVDGYTRDFDQYDVPGFAESAAQRASEAEEEEEGEEEVQGTAPGTAFDAQGGAVGLSFVGERGFVGASVSRYEANYGLPGAHEHEEGEEEGEEEEGTPVLEMEQTRIDLEAGLDAPFANVESINLRIGINDYEHSEIEPSGEAGTLFSNEAWEARAELVHEALAGWRGAVGVQGASRDFSVVGEEAFVPPVDTASVGLFWVGERPLGDMQLEAGTRVERVEHDPEVGRSRDFSLFAASLGLVNDLSDSLTFTGLIDLSSRAPVSEELYSNGPHLATQSFDIGDEDLERERALNASLSLDYDDGFWGMTATVFHTRFRDFIYQTQTGEIEDGLQVAQYIQNNARFTGLDLGGYVTLGDWAGGHFTLNGRFDTVSASVSDTNSKFLPRISPTRVGMGVDASWERLSAGLELLRVAAVDDVPPEQLPTEAYNDVRVNVTWRQPLARGVLSVFAHGRNLTDDEQRNHTSLIKDFVPLPGRNIEIGARLSF